MMPETVYREGTEIVAPQYISQGKTKPGISLEFKSRETQAAIDLSAASITMSWARFDPDEDYWYTLTATNDPTGDVNGILSYEFDAADTAVVGIYFAQFQIEYADGSLESVPSLDGLQINVV